MSITNYGELKTAINDHTAETLTSVAADLVTMAQDYLSNNLRHREMLTSTDLSPTSGVFTLPADYLQWRSVTEKASLRRSLDYITQRQSDTLYPSRPAGLGCHFIIEGNNLRVLPTITNDIELVYYKEFAAFSADEDTDWLLTKRPLLYLRTCQMMAAEYLKDDGEYSKYSAIVGQMINAMTGESQVGEMANVGITQAGVTP